MSKGGRKKAKSRSNLFLLAALVLILFCLMFTTELRSRDLRAQDESYAQKESRLSEELEAEQKRTEQLQEKKKYVGTKQYIEEVARDRLGLIDPDEVRIEESDEP